MHRRQARIIHNWILSARQLQAAPRSPHIAVLPSIVCLACMPSSRAGVTLGGPGSRCELYRETGKFGGSCPINDASLR
eukprot:scaffold24399_cov36-Tisochrysis_lutea.AAC.1